MKRKTLTVLLLAFAVFFIIQQPVEAAEMVRGTIEGARDLLRGADDSFSTFISQLL